MVIEPLNLTPYFILLFVPIFILTIFIYIFSRVMFNSFIAFMLFLFYLFHYLLYPV